MIVTLTTDFGTSDHFVAVMKGIILQKFPMANIVDITHEIPPQNTKKVYWILREIIAHFPKKTLHVIVVDPTVGSERQIIYLEAYGQKFLAPDNGILSFIKTNAINACYAIDYKDQAGLSGTFHGRDVFAPIAGEILRGTKLESLGHVYSPASIVQMKMPEISRKEREIKGEVIYIDRFGNLITNIPCTAKPQKHTIFIKNTCLQQIYHNYSEVKPGEIIALCNSSNLLEIACNLGNAAKKLEIAEGETVQYKWQ